MYLCYPGEIVEYIENPQSSLLVSWRRLEPRISCVQDGIEVCRYFLVSLEELIKLQTIQNSRHPRSSKDIFSNAIMKNRLLAVVTTPCRPYPFKVAADKFAESLLPLGLPQFGFRKWALKFRISVLIV